MARRTKQDLEKLSNTLYDIVNQLRPMTIRSLFYRAVSMGAVDKTEKEYKAICRITGVMRKQGHLPYEWLVDAGRFVRKASCWSSPKSILHAVQNQYRYDFWRDQPKQVEIWVEKDAVVGVIEEVTNSFQVPLYSCKGYPSLSMIHKAWESWDKERPICIRYFGDMDPSGQDIPRFVQDAIKEIQWSIDMDFEVIAVTQEQMIEYDLPTRPTKSSDSRAANFDGDSVELDAFSPDDLRALVRNSIVDETAHKLWSTSEIKEGVQQEQLDNAINSIEWEE